MSQLFGKNIIEVLTTGMYKDDLTIYREYIQNSADSIRKAKNDAIYDDECDISIDIEIDKDKRFIRISDNGYGIKKSDIDRCLLKVADSQKDEDEDMGYRGIGRLCGLAYCKKLKFITSYPGENIETVMTWDAEKLRIALDDPTIKSSPEELFKENISYSSNPANSEDHYFAVELYDIIDGHEDLLNKELVSYYISETAPVDYDISFPFGNKIKKYAKDHSLQLEIYNINVEGVPVLKKYNIHLYKGSNNTLQEYDKISDVDFKIFKSSSGEDIAWMWFGISAFEKKIPKDNLMRGIRLRRHNIEIGNENTLAKFFTEDRGNFYFIGELHVTHKQLRPNNQRDYFRDVTTAGVDNNKTIRVEFEESIKSFFNDELRSLYRNANKYKNALKTRDELTKAENEYKEKSERGFVNDKEKKELNDTIKKLKVKNEESEKDIERLSKVAVNNNVFSKVVDAIDEKQNSVDEKEQKYDKITNKPKNEPILNLDDLKETQNGINTNNNLITDSLINLNENEKKLVGKIYGVINKVMPEDKAIILINKIQDELNKS